MAEFKYKKSCDSCKDCRVVYANGQWSFLGCYYPPYRGKWVQEIKKCPKIDDAENILAAEMEKQAKENSAAMRKVIDFIMEG